MAGGTSTSALYGQHAVAFEDDGIDPGAVFLKNIEEKKAARAAKAKVGADRLAAANKSAEELKATGWYKHNKTRTSKRDALREGMAKDYADHDGDPYSGPEGRTRYESRQKDVADYKMFEAYSKQLQDEYKSGFQKLLDKPEQYTQESYDNFLAWKDLSFEDQMKEGLPMLTSIEEPTDFLTEIGSLKVAANKYGREKDMGDVYRTSSGISYNQDNIDRIGRAYLRSGGEGAEAFKETVVDDFTSDPNTLTYNKEPDETGVSEYDQKLEEFYLSEFSKLKKAQLSTSHVSSISPKSGSGAGDAPGELDFEAATYVDNFGEEQVQAYDITGKGDLKTIDINPEYYDQVDDEFVARNNKQLTFTPGRVYRNQYVLKKGFSFTPTSEEEKKRWKSQMSGGKVTLHKGQRVPNTMAERLRSKRNMDAVLELTDVVEGTVTIDKGIQGRETKTIRIPRSQVGPALERNYNLQETDESEFSHLFPGGETEEIDY